MSLRYLSVCSGIEAATAAWHPLGWSPAGFAEIEAFPSAVLAHHYGSNMPGQPLSKNGVPNFGDFTHIQAADCGPIDLLVGGTPCQDFSVAGLRKGLSGERGNLTLEFLRLAQRLGPRWLVWENVPGVLSNDGGRAFGAILGGMVELGYGVAYRVLDAQYVRVDGFGRAVPQRRRRVFVVGYLGDWRRAVAVLFEREGLSGHSAPSRRSGSGTAFCSAYGISPDCFDRDGEGAAGTAAERSGLGVDEELAYSLRAKRPGGVAFGGNDTRGPIEVSTALNAHGGPTGRQDFESETFVVAHPLTHNPCGDHDSREGLLVAAPIPILESGKRTGRSETDPKCGDGLGQAGDPMFTLGADSRHAIAFDCKAGANTGFAVGDIPGALRGEGHGGGHAAIAFDAYNQSASDVSHTLRRGSNAMGDQIPQVLQHWAVRRLTPRECERLQGFPDDFTAIPFRGKPAADGPRYKALGNSMAVNVMRWIGRRIEAVEAITASEVAA